MINQKNGMNPQTVQQLKQIIKSEPQTILSEDAKYALEKKKTLTAEIAISNYKKWKRS